MTNEKQVFFRQRLERGQIAEGQIATYLRSRWGFTTLPVYEKEINEFKGPQLFTPEKGLIAPDIFGFKNGICKWFETKHKTVFSWHRKTQKWVTGIDLHHYRNYLEVEQHSGWAVWLLFLHCQSEPDARDISAGCPPQCPTGLYGGTAAKLEKVINHTHENWGKGGMVYWADDKLQKIAALENFT